MPVLNDTTGAPIGVAGNPLVVSGDLQIDSAVEITNDVGNPIPVSGSVSIENQLLQGLINTELRSLTVNVSVDNFPATQPISGTVNLGTIGTAATSALQTTGNTSIASIDTKTPTVGQKASAASSPVVIASDQSAIPVSIGAIALPSGASTSALQTTGNTSLSSIDTKTPTLGQSTMSGSTPVVIASDHWPINTMAADESLKCYLTSFILRPTTLTAGSVYFAMRNSSATKNIRVRQLRILQQFAGTAAASSSDFAIQPYSHTSAPTGGTAILTDIIPVNPLNATPSALNLRASVVAGIVSGGTLDPRKILFGSTNQLAMSNEFLIQVPDSPLTMPPTAGFIVRAESAIVAGTTLRVTMLWDEY